MGESGICLVLTRDDESFLAMNISLPQEFEISWIHSVEREEWREQFLIYTDKVIRVESTRFRSFGAGLPYNAPITETLGGWVIMSGLNRKVDPLIIRSNDETAHKLIIDNQAYELPAGQYRFDVTNSCSKIKWKD